jgi:hypothetical protein
MSENDSQSIKSDRISESTIARMAGNMLAGVPEEWLYTNSVSEEANEQRRREAVRAAVETARLIAQVVAETKP